jgi:uncharacterized protein YyaL (SSP411 family)
MKSAHRSAARAKRQRVHAVSTYGLLDTLFAAPDRPMPESRRRHQLTMMYEGLRAMEQAPNPATDDWRVVSDAVNLMETLVKEMGLCEDATCLLDDAVAAMALAGARHLQDGAPIRLDGRGIAAVRAVLSDYSTMLETLSERTMTECHRLTERRIYQIQAGQRQAHDIEIMKL